MKKKFLLGLAFAALAAGGCFLAGNSTPRHQFTPDEIANIEALTAGESNCNNFNGYRRILTGNEKIYDCCYKEQVGKGKENCMRW